MHTLFDTSPAPSPCADRRQLPTPPDLAPLLWAMLDEVGCGLLLCDHGGAIRHSNHAARVELAAGRFLQRQQGRLALADRVRGDLDGPLQRAAHGGRRSLLVLQHEAQRLVLTLAPVPQVAQATDEPSLVLLMTGRPAGNELGLELLASHARLTLAERRVLGALLRGANPREIAEQHGVGLATVRTQVLSLRAKLGARSIEELLLRATEVPPLAGALRMASGWAAAARPDAPRLAA